WLSNEIKKIGLSYKNEPEKAAENEISNTIEKFSSLADDATPPLQRLERALHPFVSFVVLPIFAFANAGVTITADSLGFFTSPVTGGVILGLLLGKFLGIVLFTRAMVFFNLSNLPKGVNWSHIYGVGILAAIGFTMSLFITELAFVDDVHMVQAKIGILSASLLAGILGYVYLNFIGKKKILPPDVPGKRKGKMQVKGNLLTPV